MRVSLKISRSTLITIAAVGLLALAGGVAFAVSHNNSIAHVAQKPASVNHTTERSVPSQQSAKNTETPTSSEVPPEQAPAAAVNTPSSSTQTNPSKPHQAATSQEVPATIRVISIPNSGAAYCSGNFRVGLTYAYINTNSVAGNIHWQIEQRQNGAVSVVTSGDIVATSYPVYQIQNVGDYPAYVQSSDTAIRFHVTSPNDMTGSWVESGSMEGGSPCGASW